MSDLGLIFKAIFDAMMNGTIGPEQAFVILSCAYKVVEKGATSC